MRVVRRNPGRHGFHGKWCSNQRTGSIQAAQTVTPAPSFTNTYSLALDGVDDYIAGDATTSASSPLNDLSDAVTVAVWAKLPDSGGMLFWLANENLLVGGLPFANRWIGMQLRNDQDKILFDINTSTGRSFEFAGSTTLGDDEWHHYALTWDGSTVTYYLDGSSFATDSRGGTLDDQASKPMRHVQLGRKGYFAGTFAGNVDECAVWNVALSSDDISSIYNEGEPNDLTVAGSYDTDRTGNLVGYWRMGDGTEEASGATVYDMSGVDNTTDLTMNNMSDSSYEEEVPS